jgi:ammonia channel protein AmtB
MQTFSGLAILSTLWFVLGFTLVFSPSQGGCSIIMCPSMNLSIMRLQFRA